MHCKKNIPDSEVILTINHASQIDHIVVGSKIKKTIHYFVYDKIYERNFFGIPIMKSYLKKIEQIPIKTDSANIGSFKKAIYYLQKEKKSLLGYFQKV